MKTRRLLQVLAVTITLALLGVYVWKLQSGTKTQAKALDPKKVHFGTSKSGIIKAPPRQGK